MTQVVEDLGPSVWLKCDDTNATDGAPIGDSGSGYHHVGTQWYYAGNFWVPAEPGLTFKSGYSIRTSVLDDNLTGTRLQVHPFAGLEYRGINLAGAETKLRSSILLALVRLLPFSGDGMLDADGEYVLDARGYTIQEG